MSFLIPGTVSRTFTNGPAGLWKTVVYTFPKRCGVHFKPTVLPACSSTRSRASWVVLPVPGRDQEQARLFTIPIFKKRSSRPSLVP